MGTILRFVDRARVVGGRRLGLRDTAYLALRSTGFSARQVARMTAASIVQRGDDGQLVAWVSTARNERLVRPVTPRRAADLLEYMEAMGYWRPEARHSRPASPLFPSPRRGGWAMTVSSLKSIEGKYRRCVAAAGGSR